MQPHILVSISGHGFGHVAQSAPVLNRLSELVPQLKITIRTSVPTGHLKSRIHAPFTHLPSSGDIGMAMTSALEVDAAKSRAAYLEFHADWPRRIEEEARLLEQLKADLVFSNVGYLPLAGAQLAGIPNIAMCSLNWADIYRHYCGDDAIAAQILSCYAGADAFLRATPGMPMNDAATTGLRNLRPISPVAAIGKNMRSEINRHLGLPDDEKLVLVSMGGIDTRLPIEDWGRIDGVRYLVPGSWRANHPDAIDFETIPLSFQDLLASADLLLCKPGYGSFVEAACSGVPVLYVDRADWPESPALIQWLRLHGVCREVTRRQLEKGEFAPALCEMLKMKRGAPTQPEGLEQAAALLADRLAGY